MTLFNSYMLNYQRISTAKYSLTYVWNHPGSMMYQKPQGKQYGISFRDHIIYRIYYPLVMTNIAIENYHRNSAFFPLKMVVFHSYVSHYQRVDSIFVYWSGFTQVAPGSPSSPATLITTNGKTLVLQHTEIITSTSGMGSYEKTIQNRLESAWLQVKHPKFLPLIKHGNGKLVHSSSFISDFPNTTIHSWRFSSQPCLITRAYVNQVKIAYGSGIQNIAMSHM